MSNCRFFNLKRLALERSYRISLILDNLEYSIVLRSKIIKMLYLFLFLQFRLLVTLICLGILEWVLPMNLDIKSENLTDHF